MSAALEEARKRLNCLKDMIVEADETYYGLREPTLTDAEYDTFMAEAKAIEAEFEDLRCPGSPTNRVGQATVTKEVVPHLRKMLSLDNVFSAAQLHDFFPSTAEGFQVQPKMDGVSVELVYERGFLVEGSLRGDHLRGESVIGALRTISTVPLDLNCSDGGVPDWLAVYGEVVMPTAAFIEYNKGALKPLSNPRNGAAGALRQSDPAETRKRRLQFIAYSAFSPTLGFTTEARMLSFVKAKGFVAVPSSAAETLVEVTPLIESAYARRDKGGFPYEIDGMVVKVNRHDAQEELGEKAWTPKWGVAYKFPARNGVTKLKAVRFQVGRTGQIGPVAEVEPLNIGGVVVTNVTLSSMGNVDFLNLHEGSELVIQRAGDVIPELVEVRSRPGKPISIPDECPCCDSNLERLGEHAFCRNNRCSARILAGIRHFASREAMNIKGVGETLAYHLSGIVLDFDELYDLTECDLVTAGVGKAAAKAFVVQVEESRDTTPARVVYALGIPGIGETTANEHGVELYKWLSNQGPLVTVIPGGGAITLELREQLEAWKFEKSKMLASLFRKLRVKVPAPAGTKFAGMTFCVTGKLSKGRKEIEAWMRANGGAVASGVTSKVTHLLAGEDAGGKLNEALARKITVLGPDFIDEHWEASEATK